MKKIPLNLNTLRANMDNSEEKFYKVKTIYTFEMNYIVKALDEKEAEWMVQNMDRHDNIRGYEYDQRGLGTIVQKVKEVSEKKAREVIEEATNFNGYSGEEIKDITPWTVHYKEEEPSEEEKQNLDELLDEILLDKPVEGYGKM